MTSLAELTWVAAREREDAGLTLAVPLGSTEQHGPHLPLTTDTEIAVELVRRLASARPRVLAAPPIPYGSSGEHAGFSGTLSIGQEVLERLVIELCRSASDSFRRVILVCAHGGNGEPLARAVTRLVADGRAVSAWCPSWNGDAHAGHTETSIMLALAPDRVARHTAQAGATTPIARLMPRLRSGGVAAVSPNGVLGNPARASAEAGMTLLATAEADLVASLDRWAP